MKLALLAVLLVGCGCASVDVTKPVSNAPHLAALLRDPNGCKTECGLSVPGGADCADLEDYEREIVKGLGASQKDYSEARVCSALQGYRIEVHEKRPMDSLCDENGGGWVLFFVPSGFFCARGYTDVVNKVITLDTNDFRHSPLAHEVVHAVEGPAHRGHCRWASLPLRLAVSELMGEVDESKPEATLCSP